jgi:hypothetical protein
MINSNVYIKYCKLCTIPETRPNTEIDSSGICTGCKFHKERINTDWQKRKLELKKIFNKYKNKNNNYYDCIVPSVYSFALRPAEHQPSGTCNFSRIDTAQLQINGVSCTGITPAITSANAVVYATNYNVLRIMSGMGGLAYSN